MNTTDRSFASLLGSRAATNLSLAAVAGVLGLLVVSGGHHDAPVQFEPIANAQQPADDGEQGRISAAEQRKQIIAELKSIQTRIEKLEGVLAKGISVRVTEMPPREGDKPGK